MSGKVWPVSLMCEVLEVSTSGYIRVGKERVRVLIQRHGLKARTKRKFVVTTDSKHHLPVVPDLVQRRFKPEAPNRLWSGDSPTLPRTRAGCIWQWFWICTVGRW